MCPICWPTWAKREAHRQTAFILAYQNRNEGQKTLYDGFAKSGKKPRHMTLSPPMSVVTYIIHKTWRTIERKNEPDNMFDFYFWPLFKREIDKMIELSGIDGCTVVMHPYRIRPEYKDIISKQVRAGIASDRYDWIRKHPEWRKYVYFSPHAHLIAFGSNIDNFYEESGGWVLRVIREVYDPAGLMYYLLSHTFVTAGRNSVTRRGCLSKHHMRKEKEWSEKEEVYCEHCGANLVYANCEDDGTIISMTDRGVYRRTRCYLFHVHAPGEHPREVMVKSKPIETRRRKAPPGERMLSTNDLPGMPDQAERPRRYDKLSRIRDAMAARAGVN